MAKLLFIQPSDIAQTTVLGGNVDYDKLTFHIMNTQISVIEPLLGTELYDKIIADVTASTITGLYNTLYVDFVKPITKNQAIAEYIEIASYTLNNGGLFKHQPADAEIVDKEESQFLSNIYSKAAQMYIIRFEKWICKNILQEYKTIQTEVNARKDLKLTAGWFLPDRKIDDDFVGSSSPADYLQLD